MATTRTAPLRARQSAGLDAHPLQSSPGPAPTASSGADGDRALRRTQPAVLRGSMQGLDWRQALGAGLVALGMLGIVVAWFGVSGTLDPGEQMPYISSGGFGGSALIAIGVTLLVSFEHSRDRDALAQVLDELDDLRQQLQNPPASLDLPGDRR